MYERTILFCPVLGVSQGHFQKSHFNTANISFSLLWTITCLYYKFSEIPKQAAISFFLMFGDFKFTKVSIAEYTSIELIEVKFDKDWQKLQFSTITRSSVHIFIKNEDCFIWVKNCTKTFCTNVFNELLTRMGSPIFCF